MKIFVSWSGAKSLAVARVLREYIPYILQSAECYLSTRDLSPGQRSLSDIAQRLQECSFGISCVTRTNADTPWLNYEAGSIAKYVDESHLVPLLIDLSISDMRRDHPLSQFNAIRPEREKLADLIRQINKKLDDPLDEERCNGSFDHWWGKWEEDLNRAIQTEEPSTEGDLPVRDEADILDELLQSSKETVRLLREGAALQDNRSMDSNNTTTYHFQDTADFRLNWGIHVVSTMEQLREGWPEAKTALGLDGITVSFVSRPDKDREADLYAFIQRAHAPISINVLLPPESTPGR